MHALVMLVCGVLALFGAPTPVAAFRERSSAQHIGRPTVRCTSSIPKSQPGHQASTRRQARSATGTLTQSTRVARR